MYLCNHFLILIQRLLYQEYSRRWASKVISNNENQKVKTYIFRFWKLNYKSQFVPFRYLVITYMPSCHKTLYEINVGARRTERNNKMHHVIDMWYTQPKTDTQVGLMTKTMSWNYSLKRETWKNITKLYRFSTSIMKMTGSTRKG